MLVVYNNPQGNQDPATDVKAFKSVVGKQDANVQTTPPGTMLQQPQIRQMFDSFVLRGEAGE